MLEAHSEGRRWHRIEGQCRETGSGIGVAGLGRESAGDERWALLGVGRMIMWGSCKEA